MPGIILVVSNILTLNTAPEGRRYDDSCFTHEGTKGKKLN